MTMVFRPMYFVSVAVVVLGGSVQFYNYNVVNPEQEVLMEWINTSYYQRNGIGMDIDALNLFWSFAVSSIAVGAIGGSLLTSYLAERLGRRDALIANGIVNVGGASLMIFCEWLSSPEVFIAGRLILGLNLGLSSGLAPMYLMEITPTRYRGAAGTVHQAAVAFSDWFSLLIGLPEVLGGRDSWPIAFSFPGIPALLLCVVLPFCPESPKFSLLSRGRTDVAVRDLGRLVREEETKAMLEQLMREAASLETHRGTYRELFTRKELRFSLLIAVWIMVAQQFTGCAAVFAYSTNIFINARLSPVLARFSTLGLGVLYFIFACCSVFLIERLGRRFLSLVQLGSITVALTMMSTFTWFQKYEDSVLLSYAVVGSMAFYMCVYGVGSPIPWMIAGEIFPTKFRSVAITVSIFVSWFLLFVISLAYLPFKQIVGISASFLPFIAVSAISTCFVYFMLPETRNKQTDEIADDIKERSRSIQLAERLRLLSFSVERRRSYYSTSSSMGSLILDDSQLRYYRYMSLTKIANDSPPLPKLRNGLKAALNNGNPNDYYYRDVER